jgi:hypothetical protein
MAIALTVYCVPWDELRATPGSRRRKLVADIERNYGPRPSLDEMFRNMESPWTLGAAVRQIVNGADLDPGWGTVYAYAVEAICWSLGTMFEERFTMHERQAMDRFLKPLGCPVTLWNLSSRGSAVPIPEPGNPPSVGYWTPEEVLESGPFFEDLSLEGADQRIIRGVKEINCWLEEAFEHDGDGLVGFEY